MIHVLKGSDLATMRDCVASVAIWATALQGPARVLGMGIPYQNHPRPGCEELLSLVRMNRTLASVVLPAIMGTVLQRRVPRREGSARAGRRWNRLNLLWSRPGM